MYYKVYTGKIRHMIFVHMPWKDKIKT